MSGFSFLFSANETRVLNLDTSLLLLYPLSRIDLTRESRSHIISMSFSAESHDETTSAFVHLKFACIDSL